jgi:hypothetical protein
VQHDITLNRILRFWEPGTWHQPGIFFPRADFLKVGGLDESLRFDMDYDLMCKLLDGLRVTYTEAPLTRFRIHTESKTFADFDAGFVLENALVSRRYWSSLSPQERAMCERGSTFRLVRKAARQLLRARPTMASRLALAAWSISPRETVRNIVAHAIRLGRVGSYDYA